MLSATFDIILGLSYVFMVLSLIVTSVTELLASWLKWRAIDLEKGIKSLLQDPKLAQQFFDHPLIQNLSSSPTTAAASTGANGPSYIAATDFAAVVYNDICGAGAIAIQTPEQLKALLAKVPDPDLQQTLQTLAAKVNHNVEDFKREIEHWFDRGMDRVSGWYKRRVQWATLWTGFCVVVLLNANAVDIAQRITHDSNLQQSLISHAQDAVTAGISSSSQSASSTKLSDASEVIGWKSSPLTTIDWQAKGAFGKFASLVASNIPGWCLTAIAVSLGAPFWFDILKQVIAIRGAGKVPPKANSDDPQAAQ